MVRCINGLKRGWEQRVQINGKKISNYDTVNSGVPQGSVLGPLLFIIYINDLDSGNSSNISKFADDTKIETHISWDRETRILLGELNRMHAWAVKWQMDFDTNKCSTLHVGRHNIGNKYTIDPVHIGKSNSEKRLKNAGKSESET